MCVCQPGHLEEKEKQAKCGASAIREAAVRGDKIRTYIFQVPGKSKASKREDPMASSGDHCMAGFQVNLGAGTLLRLQHLLPTKSPENDP